MTRAFGDKRYKPFIIAEPEILVYDVNQLISEFQFRDVFLVLATDGLWNVKSRFVVIKNLFIIFAYLLGF